MTDFDIIKSTRRIAWIEKEPGFWLGKKGDTVICKISVHWTGCWLDGFEMPIVCGSVEEAKKLAENKSVHMEVICDK